MNREDMIRDIDNLFPADSEYYETSHTGQKLLEDAKRNARYHDDWRDLPRHVIEEYHRLCIEENRRQERQMSKF